MTLLDGQLALPFDVPAVPPVARPRSPRRGRLVLVDLRGEIHRQWHGLSAAGYQPAPSIGADVCKSVRRLGNFLLGRTVSPDLVCVDDGDEPTWRHREWPAYKAHRKPNEELSLALPSVREALRHEGHRVVRVPDREADDVIATLTRLAVEARQPVCIVSSDKDLLQLVNEQRRVWVYDARKDLSYATDEDVIQRIGVAPLQVASYLALAGDASDGLSGVPGIGPKGAISLLSTYGTFDAVILCAKNGVYMAKGHRQKLVANAELARTMLRLVTIDSNVELADELLEELQIHQPGGKK